MESASTKNISKPIVLIGMMGVGKTTFGKKLSAKLNLPFYDLDHEIEGAIGHSVSWIFENAGEEEFRKLEANKLQEILTGKPMILALGGGAFLSERNRDLIKKSSISIWLKASAETIFQRVSYRKDRPLLEKEGDKMELIQNMMIDRDPIYSLADYSIYTDKGSHKDIIENILKEINNS